MSFIRNARIVRVSVAAVAAAGLSFSLGTSVAAAGEPQGTEKSAFGKAKATEKRPFGQSQGRKVG